MTANERAAEFWSWFAVNHARFRALDASSKEELLDQLLERLHRYCDDLYFASPGGSEYEEFAETCGGRGMPEGSSFCD